MKARCEAEPDAHLLDAAGHAIGPRSMTTPSASRTSADPVADDAAPTSVLAHPRPRPATTSAAIVDTLIERLRSPPVPQVSTTFSCRGTGNGSAWASMDCTRPVISSTVSPLIRKAVMNAGDLGRSGRTGQHLAQGGRGFGGTEVVASDETAEDTGPPPRASNTPSVSARWSARWSARSARSAL